MSAITDAAKIADTDALKRLLAKDRALAGARDENGETPLMAALYRGHQHVVDLLIGAGAPLDAFAAAATGRGDELDRALAASPGAIDAYAYDGWTPLHLAAFFGHSTTAERLLDAGA